MILQEGISLNSTNGLSKTKSEFKAGIRANRDYIVTTVQNSAIQLYSTNTLQADYSFSLPPKSFNVSSPAVTASNQVYFASKNELKTIDLKTSAWSGQTFDASIYDLFDIDEEIVILFEDGSVHLLNQGSQLESDDDGSVISATMKGSELIMILELKDGLLFKHLKVSSEINVLASVLLPKLAAYAAIAVCSSFVAFSTQTGELTVYHLRNNSVRNQVSIALDRHMDAQKAIGLAIVDDQFIVALTKRGTDDLLTGWDANYGTLQIEKSMRQDTSTGPAQYSICSSVSEVHGKILNLVFASAGKSGTFSTSFMVVPYHAPKVNLLLSIGKKMETQKPFDSDKFEGQLSSIIPIPPPVSDRTKPLRMWKVKVSEWNAIDQEYLEKILDPKLVKVTEFQQVFIDWLFTKQASLRNWNVENVRKIKKNFVTGEATNLLVLPQAEFSQKSMALLMQKCFHNPKSFWPKAVIEYLLETGNVGSAMVAGGLIDTLIQMKDIALLFKSMEKIVDLTERDYGKILQFVTSSIEESSEAAKAIDEWYKSKKTSKKNQDSADKSELVPVGNDVNAGQMEFLQKCFSSPHVHSALAKELVALSIPQLHILFQWLRGILAPTFDDEDSSGQTWNYPLWWLWNDTTDESNSKSLLEEFQKYEIAINALGVVVDSHLATLKMSPELQLVVGEISQAIKRDAQLITTIETKLHGPLMATVSPMMIDKAKARSTKITSKHKRGQGSNWQNLVSQINIGVGEYSVEVFQI